MAIPKVLQDIREIRDESITATSAILSGSSIMLTLPMPISKGSIIKFSAPCDCSVADYVNVNNVNYTIVDALGKSVKGTGAWTVGALLSVTLDTTNSKAYLQNGATTPTATISTAIITIPAGRMRGDVDGDGYITGDDYNLLNDHLAGNSYLPDSILPYADADGDGEVTAGDAVLVKQVIDSIETTGSLGDTNNTWITNPNHLTEEMQFYVDIPIAGMTTENSAVVSIDGLHESGNFRAVCIAGKIRIYAKLLPLASMKAIVQYFAGDGSAVTLLAGTPIGSYASKSIIDDTTLYADEWTSSNILVYSNLAITENNIIELVPSIAISAEQLSALQLANIIAVRQQVGKLRLQAMGTLPTIDIPVTFIIRGDV